MTTPKSFANNANSLKVIPIYISPFLIFFKERANSLADRASKVVQEHFTSDDINSFLVTIYSKLIPEPLSLNIPSSFEVLVLTFNFQIVYFNI